MPDSREPGRGEAGILSPPPPPTFAAYTTQSFLHLCLKQSLSAGQATFPTDQEGTIFPPPLPRTKSLI